MIPDATFEPVPPSKLRLRFSLLALLVFITLICLLLAWWVQPRRARATALFQVSIHKPSLPLNPSSAPLDPLEFETYKKTQVALIKSYPVLNAAIRSPGIATLPLLANRDASWLEEHVEVQFPEDSEIMSISLRGPEEHSQDLARIVDAIAKAYTEEVVFFERQRDQTSRDLLARTLSNLTQEISRKSQHCQELTEQLGIPEDANGLLQRVDLRRLERVENELMRLDGEQLELEGESDAKRSAFVEKRIAQLREQQKEIESRLKASGRQSAELTTRRREINQLQRLADEMSTQLEKIDIQSEAPPRIRQVQPAVVSPE